ncbi:hypothetical protein ACTXMF_01370 [Psychrobacter celer]|uniref:hypothetical protein n=1 Tax=Psychrobacter celer TaxID=306572 RepID=UPI002595F71B|nr:hypothetical protein [uncultured Psychrobacter sp.]MDN5665324.1 hypothetical protein [Psychrobacter sp.]
MSRYPSVLNTLGSTSALAGVLLVMALAAQSAYAAPSVTDTAASTAAPLVEQAAPPAAGANTSLDINNTLAAQLQPSSQALSDANQQLLSRNAQLQRQVNDLQTQVNVLIYESKGQLFLYGAFTVLISLLVGIFVSWLVFVRRERW